MGLEGGQKETTQKALRVQGLSRIQQPMLHPLNVKSTTRGESQQVWVRDTDVHNLESGAGDYFSLTVAISPAPQASLLLQPSRPTVL